MYKIYTAFQIFFANFQCYVDWKLKRLNSEGVTFALVVWPKWNQKTNMELNRDTHIEIWSFYTILFAFEGKIHIQKRKLTWLKFNQNWSQLEYSAIERRKNCHIMFCQSHKFIRLVYVWNHFISWIKKLEYRIFEGKIPFRHQIILKAVGCPKRKKHTWVQSITC